MASTIGNVSLWLLFFFLTMVSSSVFAYGMNRVIRVSAAYTKGNELYLINGGRYVMLRSRTEVRRGSIADLGLPTTATVHAAIGGSTSTDPTFFFTYNGVYHATGYDVRNIPSLIRSSIDAAGERMGTQYFFKGCDYIRKWPRSSIWLQTRMRNPQLPCFIDAAWKEGFNMVILRAGKVWIWGHTGVIGPTDFSKRYNLRGSLI